MPLQFGQKPVTERIFVRIQAMDGSGHATRTQSMNVWQETFDTVADTVIEALNRRFGGGADEGVEEAPVPIKGRVRRGRKA